VISNLGYGLVLLALLFCAVGAPIGYIAGARRSAKGLLITRRLALAFAAAMLLANLVMEYALLTHDFSVSYVAHVGSLATPTHITIVSLWSSLEGSILFWGLVLGLFTAGLAIFQRRGHEDYLAYSLATVLLVGIFFSFLIVGPANPFLATPAPIPLDGPGPNPLLQNHVLMIIHPPFLYFGYVGMTIPFAMAVAALLRGHLGATWLRPLRNWLLVPTAFLTGGIMLGGWWSYEVLGWGGYWAWDPVENASFLPWLTAIAAVHSAIVQQRRGTLKAWTVVLIIITFLLTILGTFLTRSGIVNSVHSFTQSPIGPTFLIFLGLMTVAAVVLLALRIDVLASDKVDGTMAPREGAFLINNLLFVAFMFTVLVGTLYPIIAEAVRGVKVSVGEPYFNRMAIPVSFGILLMMGIGPALPWGSTDRAALKRALLYPIPAALAGLALTWVLGGQSGPMMLVGALAGYTIWVSFGQALRPTRRRMQKGESAPTALTTSFQRAPRLIGGYTVHLGVVMTFVAIAVSSTYQDSGEAVLRSGGEPLTIGSYELVLDEVEVVQDAHRVTRKARVEVFKGGESKGYLEPAMNHYPTQRDAVGTPSVRTTFTHDLYLTLMSVDRDSAGIRAIVTPAVVWIWIGVLMMVVGTFLCLLNPSAAPRAVSEPEVVAS
jgi:cytochrome c-type biogenesis protein CcmF